MNFLPISWQQLHEDVYNLSNKIIKSGNRFDLVVAIARGGMTISQILSDFLSLPVATFTISSYKDLQQEKLSEISFHVGGDVKNKNILLVDDISDSGKTFERAIDYLHGLGVLSIKTAAPLVKPKSTHLPDFFIQKTDRWVIFPYEVRETIESIVGMMKKEKQSNKEIKEKLTALGLAEKYIENFVT